MDEKIKIAYQQGFKACKKDYEHKLLAAAEDGNPIEIDGRAWFLKSDIENLRNIFDDLESEGVYE